jgi:hypothetical protein
MSSWPYPRAQSLGGELVGGEQAMASDRGRYRAREEDDPSILLRAPWLFCLYFVEVLFPFNFSVL